MRVKGAKNITNAGRHGIDNILSGDLILEAGDGSIGSAATPFYTILQPTATLTARAAQDVWIYERDGSGGAGNMNIESVYAQAGKAHLEADGSILDALTTDFTKIKANGIELKAGGDIGSGGLSPNFLDIDETGTSTITALVLGNIWLSETDGNMNVRDIVAQTGDV